MKTKNLGLICSWLACLLIALPITSFAEQTPGMTPQNPEISKTTLYEINFSLEQPLVPKSVMMFVFPEEFNMAYMRMAGSPQINGGFVVFVDGNTIEVKRTGLGDEIPANTELKLLLGNIKNPSSAGGYQIESWIEGSPNGRTASAFYDVNITKNE